MIEYFRQGRVPNEQMKVEFPYTERTKPRTEKPADVKPDRKLPEQHALYASKWNVPLKGTEDIRLLKEIDSWLGVPYKYGGTTKQGADCSGMVLTIFKDVYNIDLKRSAYDLWQQAQWIPAEQLQFGDLVFFKTIGDKVSHVGIYIANGYFVHASSSRGVVIDHLEKDYYKKRFAGAGRIPLPKH